MKPAPFAYCAPRTFAEAQDILKQHGTDARIIAGGQTLGPMLNMRVVTPSVLVDINRIDDWPNVKSSKPEAIITHALVRQFEALDPSSRLQAIPLLKMVMPYVGHYQTRNRGTICGSLAHGDPTAELPLVLILLDGVVHLTSKRLRRTVPAAEFYIGPLTTTREPEEIVAAAEWPILPNDTRFAFREVGVHGTHPALCCAAVIARTNRAGKVVDLRVGLSATADIPVRLDTSRFLHASPNNSWRSGICEAVTAELPYVSDMHATSSYRRHVAGTLVRRCLEDIFRTGE